MHLEGISEKNFQLDIKKSCLSTLHNNVNNEEPYRLKTICSCSDKTLLLYNHFHDYLALTQAITEHHHRKMNYQSIRQKFLLNNKAKKQEVKSTKSIYSL